jgi:hypothetical protein
MVTPGFSRAADGEKIRHVPGIRIKLEWHPEVGRRIGYQSRANDSHHKIWLSIEMNGRSDNIRIATVAAPPKPIAQHGNVTAIWAVFLGSKSASGDNGCTQNCKIVC